MADSRIIIELTGKDDASAVLVAALQKLSDQMRQTEDHTRKMGQASDGLKGQMDGLAGALERKVLAWASLAGAIYAAKQVMEGWYTVVSSGIKAVDDYRTAIYSSAAMMVSMSESAKPPGELYGAWKDYFVWLEARANEADRKAAASGREIFETAREMAMRGAVALNQEQVETAARITDIIKALTRVTGEERSRMQIAQEIRALYEGQLTHGAALLQLISKIDSNWKENLETAKRTGTVLDYLAKTMPTIQEFTNDLGNTWESVYSTLTNVKNLILREAFGEAYQDVVTWGQQFIDLLIQQGQLTEEGEGLAQALGKAWGEAKVQIGEALKYFIEHPEQIIGTVESIAKATGNIASAAATAAKHFNDLVNAISQAAAFFSGPLGSILAGAAAGSRFGLPGAIVGGGAAAVYHMGKSGGYGEVMPGAELQTFGMGPAGQTGLVGYGSEGEGHVSMPRSPVQVPWTPPVRKPAGAGTGGGGGGGGGKGTETQLANIMDMLNKELAKLRSGSLAEISEWYNHVIQQIQRYAGAAGQAEEVIALANQVKVAKMSKVETEFFRWYAQATGNRLEGLKLEEEDYTRKYQGIAGAREKIDEVFRQRRSDQESEYRQKSLEYQKQGVDLVSSMTPFLQDQLALKRKILDVEYLITLEGIKRSKDPQWLKDEATALAALQKQVGQYQLRKEGGGWEGWALGRVEEAQKRNSRGVASFLEGTEKFMQDSLSSGIQGVLAHDKNSLKKVGETMFQGFLGEMTKRSAIRVFDKLGEFMAPKRSGTGEKTESAAYQGSVDAASQLTKAGQSLQGSAGNLKGSAGNLQGSAGNLDASALMSTAQFGLAAGGLVLAGLGVLTGSRELVTAAMILQAAALALEIAAMVMKVMSIVPFHAGGMIYHSGGLIRAHSGYLAQDERLIVAQTGERVLSRNQNRDYEKRAHGSRVNLSVHVDARGGQAGIDWRRVAKHQIAPEIQRLIKLNRIQI